MNWTSCPVTAPSPPVLKPGLGWIPLRTELAAVKDGWMILGVNVKLFAEALRSSNATSEGELTRVGTCGVLNVGGPEVRPTSESLGKTR